MSRAVLILSSRPRMGRHFEASVAHHRMQPIFPAKMRKAQAPRKIHSRVPPAALHIQQQTANEALHWFIRCPILTLYPKHPLA